MELSSKRLNSLRESEIHGTTLRVYWHLFRTARPVGVRETQRSLAMSSPSTALYHLEKLRELGVTGKDQTGQYFILDNIQIGTLRMFLKIGRLILPRYLFYALFFTAALIAYSVQRLIQLGTSKLQCSPSEEPELPYHGMSVLECGERGYSECFHRTWLEIPVPKCRLNPVGG